MASAACIDLPDGWLSDGAASTEPCGLFVTDGGSLSDAPGDGSSVKAIALRSRHVHASVFAEHGFAEVTERLEYLCDQDCTARFVFPLPPRSAVYRFKATMGDREIVTEVKRKARAQEDFDAAVTQGHGAAHMKQQPGAGLFCVEVGNLVAMEEANVTFSYVRILNSVAGAVEFEHQATWVPPYVPAAHIEQPTGKPTHEFTEANPTFAGRASYTLGYTVSVQSLRGFSSIESPAEGLVLEDGDAPGERIARLSESVADASKDFTLLIELPRLQPSAERPGSVLLQRVTRGAELKTVALASFVPRLPAPRAAGAEGRLAPPQQIFLVIDGSGSMGGSPIRQALEAALFLVKDLPLSGPDNDVEFNIAMFGSSFKIMWPEACRRYDAGTQAEAVQWLQHNVHANWGGTEILSVLQAVYERLPLAKAASRQVVFLTDGGVGSSEEQAILSLVRGQAGSAACRAAAARTSVFALGIGHGAHRPLVQAVARESGGLAHFVVDGEDIGRKAGGLKRAALAAPGGCLTNARLAFRGVLGRNVAPNVLPARLYPNEPLHVLLELPLGWEPGASLRLTADVSSPGATAAAARAGTAARGGCTDDGAAPPGRVEMDVPLDGAPTVPGDSLAVLHAMAAIGCLLSDTSALHVTADGAPAPGGPPSAARVEDAVVELAVAEGLVTPHTSAVGVMLRRDPLIAGGVARLDVPLALPAGRSLWKAGGGGHRNGGLQGHLNAIRAAPTPMLCRAPSGAAPACMPCSAAPKKSSGGVFGAFVAGVQRATASFGGQPAAAAASFGGRPAAGAAIFGGQPAAAAASCGSRPAAAAAAPPQVMMRGEHASVPDVLQQQQAPACAHALSFFSNEPEPCDFSAHDDIADDLANDASLRAVQPYGFNPQTARSKKTKVAATPKHTRRLATPRDEEEDMVETVVSENESAAAEAATRALTPLEVLSLLNRVRTASGSMPASDEVFEALASQARAAAAATAPDGSPGMGADALRSPRHGERPSELADDSAWATLLALAFLRKHLGGERATWEGLEAKALEWLGSVWSGVGIGRSVGSMVLAAMKLV